MDKSSLLTSISIRAVNFSGKPVIKVDKLKNKFLFFWKARTVILLLLQPRPLLNPIEKIGITLSVGFRLQIIVQRKIKCNIVSDATI
jgi:hypothetical protein